MIAAPLAAAFAVGLVWAFHRLSGWKTRLTYGAALMLGVIPQGLLLMVANQVVRNQVDAGNPLFQPVFGFSAPVLMATPLAGFALLTIGRLTRKTLAQGSGAAGRLGL